MASRKHSPVGDFVSDSLRREVEGSPAAAEEYERILPFERIARQVIKRRGQLKLTQRELAKRVGTSHSVISRIESGQHPISVTTLQRLAKALDLELVLGFSTSGRSGARRQREKAA